jgi:hypothetical protein
VKIDLTTATREELIQFIRKQNAHIKQMEVIFNERQKQSHQEAETLNRLQIENENLRKLLHQKSGGNQPIDLSCNF